MRPIKQNQSLFSLVLNSSLGELEIVEKFFLNSFYSTLVKLEKNTHFIFKLELITKI